MMRLQLTMLTESKHRTCSICSNKFKYKEIQCKDKFAQVWDAAVGAHLPWSGGRTFHYRSTCIACWRPSKDEGRGQVHGEMLSDVCNMPFHWKAQALELGLKTWDAHNHIWLLNDTSWIINDNIWETCDTPDASSLGGQPLQLTCLAAGRLKRSRVWLDLERHCFARGCLCVCVYVLLCKAYLATYPSGWPIGAFATWHRDRRID
jgi:uncharacterized Zn-finger protein